MIWMIVKGFESSWTSLELDHLILSLLVTTKLEVLAALDDQKLLLLGFGALKTKDNLFGGLGLLVEDGFGLTTISGLFAIVTTLTLGIKGSLASLVLGHFESGMLIDRLGKGLSCLGHVDHLDRYSPLSLLDNRNR